MLNKKATAKIEGSRQFPQICGYVDFLQVKEGVLVTATIKGLPDNFGIFGFHIHNGKSCSGNETDPFADADGHFDTDNNPHPYHLGDLPPLFGNNGIAYMTVLTDRFSVDEIIGRVVIIHEKPDDFTTQPSGNSGLKIACGVIRSN